MLHLLTDAFRAAKWRHVNCIVKSLSSTRQNSETHTLKQANTSITLAFKHSHMQALTRCAHNVVVFQVSSLCPHSVGWLGVSAGVCVLGGDASHAQRQHAWRRHCSGWCYGGQRAGIQSVNSCFVEISRVKRMREFGGVFFDRAIIIGIILSCCLVFGEVPTGR